MPLELLGTRLPSSAAATFTTSATDMPEANSGICITGLHLVQRIATVGFHAMQIKMNSAISRDGNA